MSHEIVIVDIHMRLIQLRPEQADRLFELTDQNREYLGEFLPWPPHVQSVDDSRRHIEETIRKRLKDSSYTYGIEVDGIIAGDVSIRHLDEVEKTPEIGYWMSPDYAGKGLMIAMNHPVVEPSKKSSNAGALGADRTGSDQYILGAWCFLKASILF